ncbi:hypothetical protein KKF05_00760 [Patescibacteria group bacterium]|nr:hypothetical protein [Patescibacteria group bacterium]MBU1028961.1 hypothetical protein [Patescibacteria group bacterium]
MRAIRFKVKDWTDEQLAKRLWHLLCGDDRTPIDQRIWRTESRTSLTWSLSSNNWFLSCLAQDDATGLRTYELCYRYTFEDAELQALATVLEILLGISETKIS